MSVTIDWCTAHKSQRAPGWWWRVTPTYRCYHAREHHSLSDCHWVKAKVVPV